MSATSTTRPSPAAAAPGHEGDAGRVVGGFDGTSVVQTHMTNSRLTDPEVLEWRFPVRLDSYAIRAGSGGAGRWRGGDGGVRRVRFLEPMTASILSNGRIVPAFGMAGGARRRAGPQPRRACRRPYRAAGSHRLGGDAARRRVRHRNARRRRLGAVAAMSWRATIGMVLLAVLAGCVQAPSVPPKVEPTPAELAARRQAEAAAIERAALEARVADAVQRADEAFVYGYPLLVGEMLRLQMTGVAKAAGWRVPANSFWHAKRLGAAGEPRHPLVDDVDTLASFAWLDLGREAMLVTWPAMGRRWFSVALHSQWMRALHTAGSGIGDGKAARVLVVGPEWQGSVPQGAQLLRSPTRHALLALRIQTSGGEADLRVVHALQAQLRIVPQTVRTRRTPAEAAAAPALPTAAGGRTAQQQVAALDTAAAFEWLAHLTGRTAPPAAADEPLLAAHCGHRHRARQALSHGRDGAAGAGGAGRHRRTHGASADDAVAAAGCPDGPLAGACRPVAISAPTTPSALPSPRCNGRGPTRGNCWS